MNENTKETIEIQITLDTTKKESGIMYLSCYTELPSKIIGKSVEYSFINQLNQIKYKITKIK